MDPLTWSIIGLAGSSLVSAVAGLWQGSVNRKQSQSMHDEELALAKDQFGWGKDIDRFNMGMAARQQNEAEKVNRHQITQAQVDRLNQVLKTNADVQNQVRSLWGGR